MQWHRQPGSPYGPGMVTASTDPLARALASAFGVGAAARVDLAARGAMGRVFRLETDSGVWAAKQVFWEYPTEDEAAGLAAFIDSCRASGVSAPALLPSSSGQYVVALDAGEGPWMLQEWVDGVEPAPGDVETCRWLMVQAARIHALDLPAVDQGDDLAWYTRVDDNWDEVVDGTRAAGVAWAEPMAGRVAEFRELAAMANEVPIGPTVLCHRDLHGGNTLVGAAGRSLIDWDNAGPHEPWREVGNALLALSADPGVAASLAGDYLAGGGRDLPDGLPLFATGVAVWLNFIQAQAKLLLDPSQDADHRSHAAAAVAQMMEEMPTLAQLDAAAEAISRA